MGQHSMMSTAKKMAAWSAILAVSATSSGCATNDRVSQNDVFVAAAIATTTAFILAVPAAIGVVELARAMPVKVGELDVTMTHSPYPPEQVETYIKGLVGGNPDAIRCLSGLRVNWYEWSEVKGPPPMALDSGSGNVEAPRLPAVCGPRSVDVPYLPGTLIEASGLARSVLERPAKSGR